MKLAAAAGLNRVFVGEIERGERSVTVDTLQKLASALGVQPAELLAGNPPSQDSRDRLLRRLLLLSEGATDEQVAWFEKVARAFFEGLETFTESRNTKKKQARKKSRSGSATRRSERK